MLNKNLCALCALCGEKTHVFPEIHDYEQNDRRPDAD